MKKTVIIPAIALLAAPLSIEGHETASSPYGHLNLAYSPEVYDSLLSCSYAEQTVGSFDAFFHDFIDLESDSTISMSGALPDSVYRARLRMILSPIELPYNDIIKKYLVVYTQSRKRTLERILGTSQYYFPMIEEELIKESMPVELRMLPVIESALIPTAMSRAGACGLWQFMPATGRVYGLEITSFVDMRCDPVAATRAGCKYLKYLYGIYGDWSLAISAYNCGPGNVNKALKRAGENAKTFWDIYPYLPRETRGYFPSFVAATYAYTFHKQHQIQPCPPPLPLATDTVMVRRLMHFEQISSSLDVSVETLRMLNPQYKLDIIPALDRPYALTLPQRAVSKYIELEPEIHGKDTVYLAKYIKRSGDTYVLKDKEEFTAKHITHKVKSGEVLGSIARRYGVTTSQIMKWNKLKSANRLSVGQKLVIFK